MIATLTALAFFVWSPLDDPPVPKAPPTKEVLSAITERGRSLAGYDNACWHASDALVAKNPKPGSVVRYIARKTDAGWMVAFGKLNEKKDKFLIGYEATQGKGPKDFEVKEFDPPKEDTTFFKSAAAAIDTSLKDFRGPQRPYNVAVLPAEEGQFWVYVVPAPTQAGIWPLGGDARYRISANGDKIVEKRQMHKSIIEMAPPKDEGDNKAISGMHTHVLDAIPEDSDVFHVLTRQPAMPEVIAAGRFVFQVEPDGAIRLLGKTEDLLKKK